MPTTIYINTSIQKLIFNAIPLLICIPIWILIFIVDVSKISVGAPPHARNDIGWGLEVGWGGGACPLKKGGDCTRQGAWVPGRAEHFPHIGWREDLFRKFQLARAASSRSISRSIHVIS